MDRVLEIVPRYASAATRLRDRAFVALHPWSGIPSPHIAALRWEQVGGVLAGELLRISRVPLVIRTREYPIVLHERAVRALRDLWRAGGSPTSGPLFMCPTGARRSFSSDGRKKLIARYCKIAGVPGIDRRLLRGPFARLLHDEGWDDWTLAQAFGYRDVRDLRILIELFEEAATQIRSTEYLGFDLRVGDTSETAAVATAASLQ